MFDFYNQQLTCNTKQMALPQFSNFSKIDWAII